MSGVWRVLSSLLGAAVLFVARVSAAESPPVHLEVEPCEALDPVSIGRIFAADLGTAVTVEVGPDITEVSIACEGERVVVRVKDPLSRKTLRRSFDPKSFGNQGQSRLIAIAASELVLASWAELAANPNPQVLGEGAPVKQETLDTARSVVNARSARNQPAPTPAAELPPPEPTDTERAAPVAQEREKSREADAHHEPVLQRVMAVFSFRSFLRTSESLSGGGARIGQERYGVVSWAADALVEGGTLSDQKVTSASLGGWLAFYLESHAITFRFGGGLRAGILGLTSGPTLAAWGWPMLVSSLSFRGGPVVVELGGEAGLVDILLTHNTGAHGPWLSGQLGMGFAL